MSVDDALGGLMRRYVLLKELEVLYTLRRDLGRGSIPADIHGKIAEIERTLWPKQP